MPEFRVLVFQRKLKKFFSDLVSFILGAQEKFVMRHRILNGTLLAGIIAMGVGLSSEFFREGFEMVGLIALWVAFGFACVFYYLARFQNKFQILILPTFIISSLTSFLQIQYSGGIVSANVMLLAPILVLNMLILGKKYDWLAIVFFVSALFGVNYIQIDHPDWFYDYSTDKARREDFLITGISILFLLGLMLRTLNRSYEDAIGEVSRLKYQQDGDYYLTSLLTRPLSGIRIRSQTVQFQTYIKQKKSFQFKNREYELGGDICVADQIVLRGRSYSVFANGDAMGKSMQGAGGVLVFGTAFRALVERTHREGILSGYYPERWLHTALSDLNDVFEGFDGSMSMSLLLGLVDEETGFLYYINAEHPFPIRYREGKASFLSEEATNFKLGMHKDKARIETCWIRPGDTIIIGSDGRDDLSIGFDAEANRVINVDHTSILFQVEESGGDIESLGQRLQKVGELTDDLSLLSIRFLPGSIGEKKGHEKDLEEPIRLIQKNLHHEALTLLSSYAENHTSDPFVWKLLYRVYRKLEKPAEAARAAENFSNLHPSGLQMIFEGAIQYAKASLIEDAIDMAERLYSRKPEVIPVIKILSRLYKKSKRPEKAEEYQKEIYRLQNGQAKT
ncbi:serine/threonine-protein phosphatase [Leptospira kanakyensis]|uniref:Serine/threonine-protein phosphatase n=1 Tax=Leptospira kanakyensis TaxID=2484968 RepID=A0A6N4QLP3_9LEPT|nr:PP2C family protein-serine/threonine phosphatase [Leptospira kanakyensis]TGK53814.1 serine/threonine-protein phosphatase [Leptospira kanakyensis]TGK57609.1 serine/threonine-protein phosphatase [Leptospira kanakyensis]TGK73319.1 serine/threonine-protein phosphatase [Leptospira kanakyensis]